MPQMAKANILDDIANGVSSFFAPVVQLFTGEQNADQGVETYVAGIETYAVEGADKIVDPDTTNAWSSIAASSNSTANVGRIWTDKSVFDDDYDFTGALDGTSVVKGTNSDFLVGLSAISSTSNLKTTTTTTQPLDIVMVLDRSGSMDDSFNYYSPVFDLETGYYAPDYYIVVDGDYQQIQHDQNGWYYTTGLGWNQQRHDVTPKTSADSEGVQVYERHSGTRMDALKDAANNFIDSAAAQNAGDNLRLSIVSFSSQATIDRELTAVNDQNVNSLKRAVNNLNPDGDTYPDRAFEQAKNEIDRNGNPDAKTIVVFFTDGMPAEYGTDEFNDSLAASAVNTAHELKASKQSGGHEATIYSVCIMEGADPSVTNDEGFNAYMNAVSSNFPSATAEGNDPTNGSSSPGWNDYFRVTWGEGSTDNGYYKVAGGTNSLSAIFEEIFDEEIKDLGSGSPIEEQEGAAGTPGYLTFTDTLGSFMEVTGVGEGNNKMYLAFADGLHEGTPNEDGTEWTFSGTVNEGQGVNTAYPEGADLSEIKVKVNKSNNLATGDTITVQIPASLIPMRNYDVDTDNGTMTVSDTYPVRLFYGVSVKDGVIDALNDPQNENHGAVLAQASVDGKTIDFYSNSFVQGTAQGTTEASFTPSDGNKFYYYPVNTQLFIDENCTQPATRYNIGNYSTLYYQDSYWQLTDNGNEAKEVPTTGFITRSGNDWNVTYRDDNAYIAANTPRADRPATLVSNKGENTTETASTVLTPTWNGASVSQKLGNNGKLSIDAPGDLRIDKTVNWGNASSETQTDKNSFKFTVHLYTVGEGGAETSLTNEYDYAVYATGENPVSTGTISDNGVITLAGGQHVVISDLPNGAQYEVTEQAANQNGFATTDNSAGENAKTDDGIVEGAIIGGSQQTASFTNAYHATEVTLEDANQLVKVQKNLTGREWQDTDEFRFTMKAEGNAPAPESTDAVVVDDEDAAANYTVNLSNITFENPGEFTYVIKEDNDTNPIAGIDYSNETYAVTITVVDDGEGALKIDSVQFTQRADVDGNDPAEQPQITDNTVVFTNNYDATEATTNLNGTKDYTDNSGANPNAANKFTFELKAIGGYETEGGSADNPTIVAADVPMPEGADANTHTITIGNNGTTPNDGFAFQTIRYNGTHLNNTYIYEIREVIPEGATQNENGTWSLNGMTYDGTVHTVTVAITDEPNEQGEGVHIVATPSMRPEDVEFTNVYDPTDYTLEGEEAIHGTKVLQGREIDDNETFYFELKQTDGPETVLANPEVKTVTKDSGMDFKFSDLTFSKAGTYTFTVNEVADGQGTETTDGSGMTYSTNVAKVKVNVTDRGDGALDATVTYENQGSNETGKAVFTNVYEASMNYGAQGEGGINVTKQLLDRPMIAGEFDFTITGEGDAASMTADADESFQNTAAAADEIISMAKLQSLIFDETDAGKTYTFIVDETEPAEGEGLAGVTYDKSQYKVEIEVVDNGDGTMHAVTTVTQTVDKDGNEIADGGKVVVDHVNSDDTGYAVPTFGFVNDYNPNPVDMGEDTNNALQVTKKVTGAPSAADYTFTLTAQDTADGPVANIKGLDENHQTTETTSGTIAAGGTQTLTFNTLTFTEPGTYTFTVRENQPEADEGWTFDTTPRTITVEVTDVNPDYEPGGDAPQYDGNLYIGDVKGNNPTIQNKYDHGTVTIGTEGEAALTVEKTVKGWSTDADFHFTFTPVEEEGVDWNTVEIADGADKTAVTENFTDGAMQSATFGEITFTEPGTYKFNVIEDEAHDETVDPAGWTYDTDTETITVTVSETDVDGNYDGSLHATVDGPAKFENTYHANPGTLEGSEATFSGTKLIQGRDWLNNETFGFTMTPVEAEGVDWSTVTYKADADSDSAPIGELTATANAANDGNGIFWFAGTYIFSVEGTYTFNVTETTHNGSKLPVDGTNGMTYDRHVGVITVEVTDEGDGVLHAVATPGSVAEDAEDGSVLENDMSFENSYKPIPVVYGDDANEVLGGNKFVDDNSGSYVMADGQFTFMMRAQKPGNPMPRDLVSTSDSEGREIVSVTNKNTDTQNNTATFDFGEIEFAKPGTYQYNVYEDETSMPAGVSPQNTGRTYTITFDVTEDQSTGVLTVSASAVLLGAGDEDNTPVGLDAIDFTNVYNATKTSGSTQIFKTLNGRNWQQGDTFTFDVDMTVEGVAADEMPTFNFDNTGARVDNFTSEAGKLNYDITITPKTSETGNTYAFNTGEATYTHEGVYVYTVSERDVDSSVEGVTKDKTVYTVTVTVTNVNNALQREVSITPNVEGARLEFTNTYEATGGLNGDGQAKIEATKTLTGRDLNADEFDFEVKGNYKETPVSTGKNVDAKDGKAAAINFSPITYQISDLEKWAADPDNTGVTKDVDPETGLATYTIKYTVSEKTDGLVEVGVTPGVTSFDITVTVADQGDGTLDATVNYPSGTESLGFTNTYDELDDSNNSIEVNGKKTIVASEEWFDAPELPEGKFQFTITGERVNAAGEPEAGNPAPLPSETTVSNKADGTVDFGAIEYTVDNVWGKESQIATMSVKGDPRDAYFKYTITESGYMDGVTNADAQSFTVHVHDDGQGHVTATVIDGTANGFTFENTYTPSAGTVEGEASLKGTKVLEGRNWYAENGLETFGFTLTNANNEKDTGDWASVHVGSAEGEAFSSLEATATENGNAQVDFWFSDLSFSKPGTYTFNVTETAHNGAGLPEQSAEPVNGMTYDRHVGTITVTVTDDGSGTLQTKVDVAENDLTFTNRYESTTTVGDAEGKAQIEATKTLSGRDLRAGEFTFNVTRGDDQTFVVDGTNASADEGQSAEVTFDPISYSSNELDELAAQEGSGVTKTTDENTGLATYVIEYTVTEDQTGFDENDITPVGPTSFPVTVTLTDNGDGTMDAKVTYPNGAADFKNSYGENIPVTSDNKLSVIGEKILNSRDDVTEPLQLAENAFQFTLKGLDGAPMPAGANNNNELEVGNKADGTVDFGTIEYTVDNVWGRTPLLTRAIEGAARTKTFTYEVTESGTLPGVENDTESPKTFTVTVHDDGKGTLTVTSNPASAPLFSFTNTYNPGQTDFDPNDAKLGIQVTKNVTGNCTTEQLHKDGYDFAMTVKNVTEGAAETDGFTQAGNTATSIDDGTVSFGNITFTEVGTYKVTVAEVLPADDDEATPGIQSGNITYDEHELTYTITVTDDKDTGDLVATVDPATVSEGESTFTNVYFDEGDAKDVFFADDPQTEVDGKLVGVGDKLTYTVDWAATKAGTVTVTDTVPDGTTVDQASISKGFVYDATTGTITWTFADQALGATGTVSFSVTVDESAVDHDVVRNSATITVGDHNFTTNTTENPVPEKEEITKPGQIGEGTVLTYRISFTNADGDNASAKVVDTLTKGQAYVEGSASVAPTSVTGSAATGQTLTWDLTGLADNQQVTITFDVTITRDAGASVDNTATVNDHKTNTTTTPYPADDEKDVAFADAPTTSIDGKLVGVGDELVYTIDWAADEDGTVTVTDKIPAGTALVEGSIDNGGTVQDGVITWNLGQKSNGDKGTVSFKVTVTEDAVNVDEITNTATITVGNNDPKITNEVTVDFPKKEVADTTPDNGLQVGDTLDYTIEWANTSGGVATVTVTDTLPAGLTVDEGTISDGGTYNAETRTITWTLDNRNDGAKGTVSFSATVNEDATTVEDPVKNTATIMVGDHEYTTNTTGDGDKPATGSLAVSKTIELTEDQGTEVDANKAFEFTLELKDASGKALTNNYKVEGLEGTDSVTSGSKIELKHGQTATITGLPEGATYTVTETVDADGGYTPDEAAKSGTIAAGEVATAAFVNTYEVEPTADEVPANFSFTKQFLGRAWTEDYAFQFKLTPVDGAPMPEGTAEDGTKTITVNAPDTDGGDTATFDFGNIVYTAAGDYSYTVEELPGTNDGVTYSNNVANVTVHVTDKDAEGATTGKLVASVTNPNGLFVNTYETGDVDVDTVVANGGLQIVKNMTGRAIGEGEFTFEVEGTTPEATAKLAGGEKVVVSTKGSTLEGNTSTETVPVTTGLKFTLDDAGKEFTYNVTEVNGGKTIDGVTYDGATHTVRYVATDKGTGTLVVNAYVDGATEPAATYEGVVTRAAAVPVVIEFNNSYDAGETTVGGDADVALTGVKQLANRPLVEGEFTFNVTDAKGSFVTSGTNGADGTIRFGAITYTTEKLNADAAAGIATRVAGEGKAATYTYVYDVAEDQSGFEANGITAVKPGSSVTVTVTDDGAGKLSATVSYAEGGMVFENIYGNGENGSFTSGLAGNKVLDVESGDNAPDITGKYTFTVSVPEGAPAPERTEAVNDASGNVDFGKIVFTMEDIFGDTGDEVEAPVEADAEADAEAAGAEGAEAEADAEAETDVEAQAELESEPAEATSEPRTKTFTYTVTESGSVEGVTNDVNVTRQITYTVTDNGDGTMSVVKTAAEGSASGKDFTFTNTYSVEPTDSSLTGNGGFTIAKTLSSNTGRTLVGGEFAFQLLDAKGNVVVEGTNDANGTVSMPAVSFSAPGTYTYTLVERAGDAPSMIYDDASYAVVATVTDNGNGTLSVAWNMPDATDGAVSFANTYEADPTNVTFTAAKLLSGRDLTEGEYSFELREGDKVIETVKNAADGTVAFSTITYTEAGEHDYQFVEVKGDAKGITYDETVYTAHVSVTDNAETGALKATVTYGEAGEPVFKNTYKADPSNPITFGATKTLNGRELTAGEFTFELVDANGEVLATATNNADGSVVFSDPVIFSEAGTYTYQVREVLPEDDDANTEGVQRERVTYDETVWTATVTVTDDMQGSLHASVSYGDGASLPSFVNTYVAPPLIPDTGDHTSGVLPAVLAVGGTALVAGSLVCARRRNK